MTNPKPLKPIIASMLKHLKLYVFFFYHTTLLVDLNRRKFDMLSTDFYQQNWSFRMSSKR